MTDQKPKELLLSGSPTILDYLRRFSATEKAVFGIFAMAALITSLTMAAKANNYFTIDIPASKGTLREGLIGLPHTINPVLAATDADKDIAALVYAGLTRQKDGQTLPDLADSWSVSDDGLSYEFTLKDGLSFHDGQPLTAEDVVFTIQKIQDPILKSPRIADWIGVTATATSPTAVRFTMRQPYSAFLASTQIGIMPKHIWGNVSDSQFMFSEYNAKPIGSGPYRVAEVVRNQGGIPTSYRLSAWNRYHGDKPYIRQISFFFFADEDRALSALASGAIDSLPAVSPSEAVKLALNSGEPYMVTAVPLTRVFGVFLNQNSNPVLADSVVRQALNIAVDRAAIVESSIYGYGTPLSGLLPPGFPAGMDSTPTDSTGTDSWSANIEGAQALLEKSGWQKGADGIYAKKAAGSTPARTLSLSLYTADAPELKQAAELVRNSWTALGASVDLRVFEPNDLYQSVIRSRSYDALLFGEAIGRDGDMYAFWHSSQRNAPGLNVSMYVNAKADGLLEDIRSESDPATRAELFLKLDEVIRADVPAIFLYSPDFVYIVPKSLRGMETRSISSPSERWNSISDWYVETEKVWNIFAKKDTDEQNKIIEP